MKLQIQVDKTASASAYQQVADQIRQLVETGVLKPGERLPTERELSENLGLARGTINRAYEILERDSIIKVIPGSGSYVFDDSDATRSERQELAVSIVRDLLKKLDNLHFTIAEVHALLDLAASEQDRKPKRVLIAAIDCNPESLDVFHEQFSGNESIELKTFLLDDILRFTDPETIFRSFDLIITTTTHFEQIASLMPALRDCIFKVVVSPTQSDIIAIATAPRDSRMGMIVRSQKYATIIAAFLETVNIDPAGVPCAFEDDIFDVNKLILETDILIIPHMLLASNPRLAGQLRHFRRRGGLIVDFHHQIEQGSIIHVEELIERLLSDMDKPETVNHTDEHRWRGERS